MLGHQETTPRPAFTGSAAAGAVPGSAVLGGAASTAPPAASHRTRPKSSAAGENPAGIPVLVFGPDRFLPRAFSLGCSDFIKEPFTYPELKARALKRVPPPVIRIKNRRYMLSTSGLSPCSPGHNSASGEACESCPLTYPEVTILRMLISNRGAPVYREALQYALWGERRGSSRAVDMHVTSLRRKLMNLGEESSPILTVRNVGYQLSAENCTTSCG